MNEDHPIVFAAKLPDEEYSQIYRINPDGTGRMPVTHFKADDYDPQWLPDGKRVAFQRKVGKRELRMVTTADGKTPVRLATGPDKDTPGGTERTDALGLPDGREVAPVRKGSVVVALTIRPTGGKPAQTLPIRLTPEAKKLFDRIGISGGILGIAPLPKGLNAVLGYQLAGGNREGKWHVAVRIDLATGIATPWGEFGFAGMVFAPDGKRFLTSFNRKNVKTGRDEHTLCIGQTASPGKLRTLASSADRIHADWRGGQRVRGIAE